MKYAIQNTSGQWWTGSCWGVEQAREEYASMDDLPFEVDANNVADGTVLERLDDDWNEPCECLYYYVNRDGDLTSPDAHVEEIREAGDPPTWE